MDNFCCESQSNRTQLDLNVYGFKFRIISDAEYIEEYKKYYREFITNNESVEITFDFTIYKDMSEAAAVKFKQNELAYERWPDIFCVEFNSGLYHFLIPHMRYPVVLMGQIVSGIVCERYAGVGILPIHAGAVSKDGKAILFIGEKRSGKTTLSLSMANSGFKYYTDDVTLINIARKEVLPYYKGITPRLNTVKMYPELIQNDYSHEYTDFDDRETRWCVELEKVFAGRLSGVSKLGYIIFPKYNPDREFSYSRPDKNKSILLLMRNMKLVPTKVMGTSIIPILDELIDKLDIFCISYPDSTRMVEFVDSLYRGEIRE